MQNAFLHQTGSQTISFSRDVMEIMDNVKNSEKSPTRLNMKTSGLPKWLVFLHKM
ncbi:hypothetical protein [Bacillus atrophaeus]|uniref:hypothetical protein n=1 Tax=Bacillus atrophaeus TaxID=1452 RepID=UPI001CB9D436|nr:hypothetical protein [Bacillus atrophaeus]MCY8858263.1 hypothetical protein [Bacillus atrophaeus]